MVADNQIEAERVIPLPIKWKGLQITLKMNVLNQKVPTLLGMEEMMKMNAQLDIANQKMIINGANRKIKINETGHIIWDNVSIDKEKLTNEKQKMEEIFAMTETDCIEKKIKKIHIKTGHATKEKLEQMFKNTSLEKTLGRKRIQQEIKEIIEKGIPCSEVEKPKHTKKANDKARSQQFNGSIAIDLTEWFDKRRQQILSAT